MALINPSSLYGGGNVVLDSVPFAKFALQQEAQKKAKQEALDKYFADQMTKVTSTGMREAEIPTLNQIKNNIQDFWINNKEKINNTGKYGTAYWQQYNRMLNDAKTLIEESKSQKGMTDKANELRMTNHDLANRMKTKTLERLDRNAQPMYILEGGELVRNPQYQPLDFNAFSYNPKDYTTKDWESYKSGIVKKYEKFATPQITSKVMPTDPNRMLETKELKYSPQVLNQIVDDAIRDYEGNDDLSYNFDKLHNLVKDDFSQWQQSHVDEYNNLNNIYKQVKNKNIESPEELHAAEILRLTTTPQVQVKTVVKRQPQGSRSGGGSSKNISTLNDVYDEIELETNDAKNKGYDYNAVNTLSTEAQKVIIEEAKKLTGENDIGNDEVVLRKIGNNVALYWATKGKPNFTKAGGGLIGYLTRKGVNLKAQPTAKMKENVIKQEQKSTTTQNKVAPSKKEKITW